MKRYLIFLASLMLCVLPTMANPHGKDYSVGRGHGSSLTFLFVFVLIGIFIYCQISYMFNKKNKK